MLAQPDNVQIEWPGFAIPPRSRLFNLPPIGLGTGHVESLTSYLVRLARAHAVSPRLLVKTEFANADPAMPGVVGGSFFRRYAGTMNGLGKYAEMFSATTAQLTTVESLRQLTLLPLARLLPHNGAGLLATHPKWCPCCLAEMDEPFRPLIWNLKLYRACERHDLALESLCPGCGRHQPFIPRYPALGVCAYCGQPLTQSQAPQPTEQDIWLARSVSEFLTELIHLEPMLTREHFLAQVTKLMESRNQGNRAAFLGEAGLPRWFLNHWFNKGERPSFVQLMRLCYGLTITPLELFRPQLPVPSPRIADHLLARRSSPRVTANSRHEIQHTLNEILSAANDSSPAYVVAEKLGLTRSGLRYLFPDQYSTLRDNNLKARMQRTSLRYQRLVLKIKALVEEMRARGEYPGRRKINQRLRAYGASLSEPPLLAAYRKELMP